MNKIGNELILCSQTYDDTSDFRKFGNTLLHRCTIDMTSLRRDIYITYFYQMYLRTNETNFQIIPVRIVNNDDIKQANNIVKRFFFFF